MNRWVWVGLLAALSACTTADLQALTQTLPRTGGSAGPGTSTTTTPRTTTTGGTTTAPQPGAEPALAPSWQVPDIGETAKDTAWHQTAEVNVEEDFGRTPQAVAYAPDGGTLYLGFDNGEVMAWDVAGNKARWTVKAVVADEGGTSDIQGVTASPDGRRVAVWRNNQNTLQGINALHVLSADDGSLVADLSTKSFSPGCSDEDLYPYQVEFDANGAIFALYFNILPGNKGACHPDLDNTILRWDVDSKAVAWHYKIKIPACGENGPETCGHIPTFRLNPHGSNIAGGMCDGSIFFLDQATGQEVGRAPCPPEQPSGEVLGVENRPRAMAWGVGGDRLFTSFGGTGDGDYKVVVYDGAGASNPQPLKVVGKVNGVGPRLECTADGQFLVEGLGRTWVHDIATGKLVYSFRDDQPAIAVNPRRREIATLHRRGFHLHTD
jgi:hypothetical protein